MPILKTVTGSLLVRLGFSFLAGLSAAVTYVGLNTSMCSYNLLSQKQMFGHRFMGHERLTVSTCLDLKYDK